MPVWADVRVYGRYTRLRKALALVRAPTRKMARQFTGTSPADRQKLPEVGRRPQGYDCQAVVLFNRHARDIWRRFTTYLSATWPRLAGLTP